MRKRVRTSTWGLGRDEAVEAFSPYFSQDPARALFSRPLSEGGKGFMRDAIRAKT